MRFQLENRLSNFLKRTVLFKNNITKTGESVFWGISALN